MQPGRILLTLLALSACVERDPTGTNDVDFQVAASQVIVSGTITIAPLSGSAVLASPLVYVSLAPGTVEGGTRASIRNMDTGIAVGVDILDGGFDPIGIAATVGQRLELVIFQGIRAAARTEVVVPVRRPPRIVRTSPASRKIDVPLNASVVIVFSEPVDTATLDTASVRLLHGSSRVGGRIEIMGSEHLKAQFIPESPLVPGSTYLLQIGDAILDLDGTPLEAPVTVEFTTAGTPPPLSQIAFWSAGLRVMNADGTGSRQLTSGATDYTPSWSPDGRTVVFSTDRVEVFDSDIWAINADGSGLRPLTSGPDHDRFPAWSPDGSRIAFTRGECANAACTSQPAYLWIMNQDGSGAHRLAGPGSGDDGGPAWSPDGSRIVFPLYRDAISDLYIVDADGSNMTRLTSTTANEGWPAWSPDGQRIAYVRIQDYTSDLHVIRSDGSGDTVIARGIDVRPTWSPDGHMIAFGAAGRIVIAGSDGSAPRIIAEGTSPSWSRVGSVPATASLSIRIVEGNAAVDTVESTVQMRVQVLQGDVPAAGVEVAWETGYSYRQSSLARRITYTDQTGNAVNALTFGHEAGRHEAIASVRDARGSPVVMFTATSTAGNPVSIEPAPHDLPFGIAGASLPFDYAVRVLDRHRNAVPGVPISWQVIEGGGSISPTGDRTGGLPTDTDAAMIPHLLSLNFAWARHTLGAGEGAQRVTASAPTVGGGSPVTFTIRSVSAIVDVEMLPGDVTVPSGRTVGWFLSHWPGHEAHSITFEDEPGASYELATIPYTSMSFTRTFTGEPRIIRYRCTLHSTGFNDGEVGRVIVQ